MISANPSPPERTRRASRYSGEPFAYKPTGYTFIELIAAMTASTIMLVALASTIAISTSLVEPTDEDGIGARDRMIADRLSNDLRYATSINTQSGYGIDITRPDLQGASLSLNYETYLDGMVRQVSGAGSVTLDPESPSVSHYVDGYSAPTWNLTQRTPRIISVSSAVTDGGAAATLSVEAPKGSVTGDLLVAVIAYQNSSFLNLSTPNWMPLQSQSNSGVNLLVSSHVVTPLSPPSHVVSFTAGADVAAAILAIEDTLPSSPFGWIGTRIGSAVLGSSSTYPYPFDNGTNSSGSATNDASMQLQFFAQNGSPWPTQTLGLASFSDCFSLTGSKGTTNEISLGVVTRVGPMPTLGNRPRTWQSEPGNWVNVAVQVNGGY